MRFVARRKAMPLVIVLVSLALQVSCLSRRRVVPIEERMLPARTATRSELLQTLEQTSRAIDRLTASVTLDASGGGATTGVLTEYRQTKGSIVVERPSQIRIIAQAPLALATVFDMVSDGKVFRVWIPVRNQFYEGDTQKPSTSKNAIANLRPQHIMEALFVDITPYLNRAGTLAILEEAVVGRNSYYVFSFIDTAAEQLLEKIWIDRFNLEVRRKEIFGPDGKVETDVEYTEYDAEEGSPSFPQVINIQRPVGDYALKITFQRTTMNGTLAPNAFQLPRPDGAEIVRLDESASPQPN
jgi:outer membrane lipoprotein-sorting protein